MCGLNESSLLCSVSDVIMLQSSFITKSFIPYWELSEHLRFGDQRVEIPSKLGRSSFPTLLGQLVILLGSLES